jgi:hypothetical protein
LSDPAAGATLGVAPLAFAYHRALAPMMWAFLALAGLELFVVHFLVSIWSVRAALLLSAATIASMAWMILLIRSFRRLPVLLDADELVMRSGRLIEVRVKLTQIEAVHGHFAGEALKSRAVLNLAMMSYPNLLIDLRAPIRRGRRSIERIAHRLDDPAAFIAALKARMNGDAQG